jgi:hypothetical protein
MEQDALRKIVKKQSVENLDNFYNKKQGKVHSISRNLAHFIENWFLSLTAKKGQKTPSVILSF